MNRPKPKIPKVGKVSRFKRKVAHEVYPTTVMGPLGQARMNLDWLMRSQKEGFTEKELAYLAKRREQMMELSEDIQKIYFRLKF